MRKVFISIAIVLLLAAPAFAGYPEEYYGVPLEDGCFEIEAFIPEGGWHDMNPWGMISPEENIIWFGELCVENDVATLEFTQVGTRHCTSSIYNHNIEQCWAWLFNPVGVSDPVVMFWDNGFYLTSVDFGDNFYAYDALTVNADGTMVYVEGVFEFVTPLWFYESDEFTRTRYNVSERQTDIRNRQPKRSLGRRGR